MIEIRSAIEHRLQAKPGAAVRVMQMCDDPMTEATDLASAVGADPLLTANLMRVANSAYYGLSGRVSTLGFAVTVVGFAHVRSLAALAATGLGSEDAAPENFWEIAALSAIGAELVAPSVGAVPVDGFMVGLLHTLGTALLHQVGAHPTLCLPGHDDLQLCLSEREELGLDHADLGAQILSSWHFPPALCSAIAEHHEATTPSSPPLQRALHIARELTTSCLDPEFDGGDAYAWLSEGVITATGAQGLRHEMKARAQALVEGLRPKG